MKNNLPSKLIDTQGLLWAGIGIVDSQHRNNSDMVRVAVDVLTASEALWCRCTKRTGIPEIGEQVLVLRLCDGTGIVVDTLNCLSTVTHEQTQIEASNGASAQRSGTPGNQTLTLSSPQGEVVAEYHVDDGIISINATNQNLNISAPCNSMHLRCGGVFTLDAAGVEMRGRGGIRFIAGSNANQYADATCTVLPNSINMSAHSVAAHTSSLAIDADRAQFDARRGKIAIDDLEMNGSVSRIRFNRVSTRIGSLLHTVERSARLNVQRLLIFTKETASIRARRIDARAREDAKIDGQQIHLG